MFLRFKPQSNACETELSSFRKRRGSREVRGRLAFEQLEERCVLSAAFDLISLTALRADPEFRDIDGTGIAVAVIDTGVDINNPWLRPNLVAGRDLVRGGDNPIPVGPHGTHVAGIVGATDPEVGVATDVDLIGLQVFTPNGTDRPGAYDHHIEDALQWVLANARRLNILAVNMSLGGGFFTSANEVSSSLEDEIRALEQAGVTVVSAAGNSYGLEPLPNGSFKDRQYPNSGAPGILSTLNVGAVWETSEGAGQPIGSFIFDRSTAADRITPFSQRPPLDSGNAIFAPGALINSTVLNNRFEEFPGTSMAAPMIAGVVALMQEAAFKFGGRYLSPQEVREIMISTADAVNDGDDEDSYVYWDINNDRQLTENEIQRYTPTNLTYPRVNVLNAVREVKRRLEGVAPPPGGPETSGDPNGTIAGAFLGPQLNGAPTEALSGTIGIDGGNVSVGSADVDMFRFEVLSPGVVTISTDSNLTTANDFDTALRLFDPLGVELATNDDDERGNGFSRIQANLPLGTYFVGVSGFPNVSYDPLRASSGASGATGDYSLSIQLSNLDPNGLKSGAVPINFDNDEPVVRQGSIGFDYGQPVGASDVDLFKVHVIDDGYLLVDIDTPFDSGYVDSFVRVFDEQGVEFFRSDDDLSEGEFIDPSFPEFVFEAPNSSTFSGHLTDSAGVINVKRGDVIYVGVSDYFNQNYEVNSLENRPPSGTGGAYNLFLSFVNLDRNGSITQAVDATENSLPLVGQLGVIGVDGLPNGGNQLVGDRDVDFIRIRPQEDGILEVDIDSYSVTDNQSPVDSVLLVMSENGELLAVNDDQDGPDPLVRLDVIAGQDYYVAITGFGNDNFDPFQLASGSSGDTGLYYVNARLLPLNEAQAFRNDRIADFGVSILEVNQIVQESIGTDDGYHRGLADVDVFEFTAPESRSYVFSTGAISGFSASAILRVFDASGLELAAINDMTESINRSVRLSLLAGQKVFLGVNGFSQNATNYNPISGENAAVAAYGGSYSLKATPAEPYLNASNSLDVDNDGNVVPLDALYIINALNQAGAGALAPPLFFENVSLFIDPTGDNLLAPLDALIVINFLNRSEMVGEWVNALPQSFGSPADQAFTLKEEERFEFFESLTNNAPVPATQYAAFIPVLDPSNHDEILWGSEFNASDSEELALSVDLLVSTQDALAQDLLVPMTSDAVQ